MTDKTEYGYGETLAARLHRTHSDFENDVSYRGYWINRHTLWYQNQDGTGGPHVFNLVKEAAAYAADDTTKVAHARYRYDEQSLVARSDAGQLASAPTQRGNLTTVK